MGSLCVLHIVILAYPGGVLCETKFLLSVLPLLRNQQMCKQDDRLNLQVQTGDNVVLLSASSEMEELRGQTELQQQTLQEILDAQKQLEKYAEQMREMMKAEHAWKKTGYPGQNIVFLLKGVYFGNAPPCKSITLYVCANNE